MTINEIIAVLRRARLGLLLVPLLLVTAFLGLQRVAPPAYVATAMMLPPAAADGAGGLTSLAGQLGLRIGGMSSDPGPAFYAALSRDPYVMRRVIDAMIKADAGDTAKEQLRTLFAVSTTAPDTLVEEVSQQLAKAVEVRLDLDGGFLVVQLALPDREAAIRLVSGIVEELVRLDTERRQQRGAANQSFADERLRQEGAALRAAEDRVAAFERANRQWRSSPELTVALRRLEAEVTQRQEVVSGMRAAFDQSRLEALRSTPQLTVVQEAWSPIVPSPRHLLFRSVVLAFLGMVAVAGAAVAAAWLRLARERAAAAANGGRQAPATLPATDLAA